MSTTQEKNCPYCGSPAMLSKHHAEFFVHCTHDRCFMTSPKRRTEAEAIASWNMFSPVKTVASMKESLLGFWEKIQGDEYEEIRKMVQPAVIKATML